MPLLSAAISGLFLAVSLWDENTSWLAAGALVPLLFHLIKYPPSTGISLVCGWICGLIAYGIHFRYAMQALNISIFVMLLLYVSLYVGLFSVGVSYVARRNRELACVISPFLWTALEFVRATAFTGLQVGSLGASQVRVLPLVQIVSVTGVFGLSFLLVVVSVTLTRYLIRSPLSGRYTTLWLAASTIMMLGAATYGTLALRSQPGNGDVVRMATIQAAIDERNQDPGEVHEQIIRRYRTLLGELDDYRVDLTVLPETMTGSYLASDSAFLTLVAEMGERTGSAFLIGSRHLEADELTYGLYNSAFLLSKTGQIQNRYDKINLVPFGEYTPAGIRFPWLSRYRISKAELTPGRTLKPLQMPSLPPLGVGICYEAMYAGHMRAMVNAGARILVVISDDFWFAGTDESRQFFNEAILRAVENSVPVVRCANLGVSGIIDARGRIVSYPEDGRSKVQIGIASMGGGNSIYSRYGDILPIFCLSLCAVVFAWCAWPPGIRNRP